MAEQLAVDQINFLVPLLLVIVERLATLTRSIADEPEGYARREPILVPVDDGDGVVPRLGRLNLLHLTNTVLLTVSFILLAATEQGLVTNVLAVVVAIVWLQLPLIEVDLYDDIRDDLGERWPTSLYAHAAGTVVVMAYVAGFAGFDPAFFLQEGDLFSPDPGLVLGNPAQLGASALLAVLVVATALAFLTRFETEVEAAVGDGGAGAETGEASAAEDGDEAGREDPDGDGA